ncbi:hypothetical protein K1719_016519 [Acacia pycnantha]|nr:hypothetical protein K1719_016519 [Acacia pycnantha]
MSIIDLNIVDDQQSHELIFSPTHQPSYSSSSLSPSSCPILFNPSHQLQDHAGSSYLEYKNLQNDHDEACGKNITGSSGGSWNDPDQEKGGGGGVEIRKRGLKLKVWKRSSAASGSSEKEEDEENNHNHNQTEDNYDSMKWMPSKMRMMRKMMVASSDHNHNNNNKVSSSSSSEDQNQHQNQYRNQQRPLLSSPRGNDNSSSSNNSSTQSNTNNNNNITVRVCADCHTTKTPLWRSGPRGPKSLCNACGIRQRKARRAMAAAAAASNGGSPLDLKAAEKSAMKRTYKVHSSKEKKLKFERETTHHQIMKKKQKVEDDDDHQDKEANNNNSSGKSPSSSPSIINKFSSFEDFTVSLMSKNLATSSQVFPQDEKEAAILLMALSCNGLVHG